MPPPKFTATDYKKFDRSMKYRADKKACVESYNKLFGTTFKYISEFIHKTYELGFKAIEIGNIVEITEDAVYKILVKMGVPRDKNMGENNTCKLSGEEISEIRASQERPSFLATIYSASPPTIRRIIRREGRWGGI